MIVECLSRIFTDEAKAKHYPCNARVSRTFYNMCKKKRKNKIAHTRSREIR